jgi:hypothetical protein
LPTGPISGCLSASLKIGLFLVVCEYEPRHSFDRFKAEDAPVASWLAHMRRARRTYTPSRWFRSSGVSRHKGAQGKLVLDDPKTSSSRRSVGPDPYLIKILKAHRRANPTAQFVFTAKEGAFIYKDTFRGRVWLPLLEKAKLPHFRFHSLRVFGNTWLANKGVNLRVLQAPSGTVIPA